MCAFASDGGKIHGAVAIVPRYSHHFRVNTFGDQSFTADLEPILRLDRNSITCLDSSGLRGDRVNPNVHLVWGVFLVVFILPGIFHCHPHNHQGYLEVGGGIRTESDIEHYRALGVEGIIVGTTALTDPAFFRNLSSAADIVLGLDLDRGRPMIKGWTREAAIGARELLTRAEEKQALAVLFTSISRDGTLEGPDFAGIESMIALTRLPIIASGGVSSIDDLKRLKGMGAWATIIGKALYEGRIQVGEAASYAD